MTPARSHLRVSDLRGAARLAIDATIGVTDLVETLQHGVMRFRGTVAAERASPWTLSTAREGVAQ